MVNLRLHGSPDSFSSHRVGLGDALVYRFETTNREFRESGGIDEKIRQLWGLQPTLRILSALSLIAIALYVRRTSQPVWRLIWLSIFPLFILTTPQINYYNLRLLPVLLHAEQLDRWEHRAALAMLFLIEVAAQYIMVERMPRYTVTSVTSLGLCVYLAFMIVVLVWETTRGRSGPNEASAKA